MAARSPRRSFARPFVVTLATVVPSTACHTSNPPVQHEGPPGGQVATAPPSEPPPPPEPATASADERVQRWTIAMRDGSCEAHVETTCPPETRCNPPRPSIYPCPPGLTEGEVVTITKAAGQDECFVQPEVPRCPPGAMCNPPPPQKIDCPQ